MEKHQKRQNRELVFQFDLNLLKEIVAILKSYNYHNIQYIPYQHSFLAIVKEHENIFNFFTKKRHLLFYYSLFPKFYRFFLSKKLRICFDVCFLSKYISKAELLKIFSENLINRAILNNILYQKNDMLRFSLSFMPFDDYIYILTK